GQRPALVLGMDLDANDGEFRDEVEISLTGRAGRMIDAFMIGCKPALLGRDLDAALSREGPYVTVTIAGRPVRLLRAGTLRGRGGCAGAAAPPRCPATYWRCRSATPRRCSAGATGSPGSTWASPRGPIARTWRAAWPRPSASAPAWPHRRTTTRGSAR